MKLTMLVDLGEGPFEVSTNLHVGVQFERKFKRKMFDGNGLGIEDLCYLAYESCKTHAITVPVVFDDFIRRAISIEVIDTANPSLTPAEHTDIP